MFKIAPENIPQVKIIPVLILIGIWFYIKPSIGQAIAGLFFLWAIWKIIDSCADDMNAQNEDRADLGV